MESSFLTRDQTLSLWSSCTDSKTLDYQRTNPAAAAAGKSLQSCPTLCDPIDGSPPGSAVPRILQARTMEWVAISFSNAWKWKVKVKLLSHVWLLATPRTAAYQAPPSMDFPGKSTGVGCHRLLQRTNPREYQIVRTPIKETTWIQDLALPNHRLHPVQDTSSKQPTKKHKPNHQQTGLPHHSALPIRGKTKKQTKKQLSTKLDIASLHKPLHQT